MTKEIKYFCCTYRLRISPGGGHGNPLQVSCLEDPIYRGAWRATVHRIAESDTTEHACLHASIHTYIFILAGSPSILLPKHCDPLDISQISEGQITSCCLDLNAHSANMLTCFFFKKNIIGM